ncbi:alpha-L-rhamnosidase C-terminal domain-containing protein [Streptomyces sp. NPDC058221]|uniref:alpha-L-rhamnosidase-related protein n=1 Tax=Streptomyces sp. NPDC058221 TaxID=3346388 RepID=UPI0036E44E76
MHHESGEGPRRRAFLAGGLVAAATAAGALPGTAAAAEPAGTASGTAAAPAGSPAAGVPAAAAPAKTTAPRPYRKAPAGRWDANNLSPASRTVRPVAVHTTTGTVEGAASLTSRHGSGAARLTGAGSSVTLDFGKEVGGFAALTVAGSSAEDGIVGLTYSELSTYVSPSASDGSNGGSNIEPAVRYPAAPGGRVDTSKDVPVAEDGSARAVTPASQQRGGFRYLTLVNESGGTLALTGVTVQITFAPNARDLRAYPNYFHCDDDLLNRIWYAGAYTVQTNIIASDEGRVWGPPDSGWANDATVGELGSTVLVDGAKRDRTIWPGDLGISVLTDHVSLGDLVTVRNALQTLYNHQDPASGALPYAGPAVNFIGNSDAYHLWTLIGTASYAQLSGDLDWTRTVYDAYLKALAHVVGKIDTDGLLNVTAAADWARTDADGKNLEANAIMYRALITAGPLARSMDDAATADACAERAEKLRQAVDTEGYWDASAGLYRDKPTGAGAELYPQDGNALALWFGLVTDPARARTVSAALAKRWTAVGALTPEKGADSVHPFPGGMEVHAHFAAGRDSTALELIRREWGFMLNAPHGTASTFWEGYRTDGTSDYGGSYLSAAHGWSTGPTSALTYFLLGIAPSQDGGPGYSVAPRPGGLRRAEGQLTTPEGVIRVSWRVRSHHGFDLSLSAPAAVVGEVAVPVPEGSDYVVRVDGRRVWDGRSLAHGARAEAGQVVLSGLSGRSHQVTVRRS